MKATEIKLLDFLKKSPQFVIPIYQRTYSWGERECAQLWDDIIRTGENREISAHFVGSIVYVEKGLYSVSNQSQLLVIDGQQRLTTVNLLIEAIARRLGNDEIKEGFSAKTLRDYFLLDPREEGDSKYKLILSQTDGPTLKTILNQDDYPKDFSLRIKDNFEYFFNKLDSDNMEISTVLKGLAKLIIVDISLSRDQDNPQLIFESLNSTGRELSQADLIRNYILMGQEPELQLRLYNEYWRPMEIDFGQKGYSEYFDGFMRHYITVKTGVIPRISAVYEAFKKYAQSPQAADVENIVLDIRKYSKYYCAIGLGAEPDPSLKEAFKDLRELRVDVAYPILLELYKDYAEDVISSEELLKAIRLIESYVFRRAVCNIPTNSLNKTFANFVKFIDKSNYLESVVAHFLLLPSYRRFPDNEEFIKEFKIKDLYNFRNKSYWLRKLENFDKKELINVEEFTIEHIMPQNENLSKSWKSDLGEDYERIHNTYLNTLGNLTLTGYNSEYSDRSFSEKLTMQGGFSESPLKLNRFVGKKEKWGEEEIIERANILAKIATEVWVYPNIDNDTLGKYKPVENTTEYSIEDHPYLSNEHVKELFGEFRKQVLAIDPCVTETYLKRYVAYKAETNFVDVIPQANRLILSINLPFIDIEDHKEICRDVSKIGRWGNGEIEVTLCSLIDLPYAMGLIRKAFEKQMDSEDYDS